MEGQIFEKFKNSFQEEILRKAANVADTYNIIVRKSPQGGFVGTCAEVRVSVHRPTADECYRSTYEGIVAVVASILEDGDVPPAPMELHRRME